MRGVEYNSHSDGEMEEAEEIATELESSHIHWKWKIPPGIFQPQVTDSIAFEQVPMWSVLPYFDIDNSFKILYRCRARKYFGDI